LGRMGRIGRGKKPNGTQTLMYHTWEGIEKITERGREKLLVGVFKKHSPVGDHTR